MTGFNHAASGGLIGRFLPLPIAIPLAFISHFALDSLPHYGIPHSKRDRSLRWRIFSIADFIATVGLAALAISWHKYAMLACGFVACSPDFFWVARVIKTKSFDLSKNRSKFTKWHVKIQRLERPWGIWLEMPLSVVLFYFVWHFGAR
jgi:hypothetical protein